MKTGILKQLTVVGLLGLAIDQISYTQAKTITKKIIPKQLIAASTPIDTNITANNSIGAVVGQPSTSATFWDQLAIQNVAKPSGTYANNPAVALQGRINIEQADIGYSGEIIIVAFYNGVWYMRTEASGTLTDLWVPWNSQVSSLQATGPAQPLTATIDFDIVSNLSLLGSYSVYIGYRSAGILHYSATPFNFNLILCNSPQVVQSGACVNPPAPLSVFTATGKLNDTGITLWADTSSNVLTSPQAAFPGQDADFGRDVTDNNPNDGHAGFSFTKICGNGDEAGQGTCPANPVMPATTTPGSTEWACTKDNVTGLIWEFNIHAQRTWNCISPLEGGRAVLHRRQARELSTNVFVNFKDYLSSWYFTYFCIISESKPTVSTQ